MCETENKSGRLPIILKSNLCYNNRGERISRFLFVQPGKTGRRSGKICTSAKRPRVVATTEERYIFFLLPNVFVYHLFCRFQQGGASPVVALLLTPERQVTILLHLEFRAVVAVAKVFRDMCS